MRAPYSHVTVEKCRRVGGSWNKAERVWTFALDLTVCRDLRREFGKDLEIGPNLWAWALTERERAEEIGSLHAAHGSETVDCPNVRKLAPTIWAAVEQRGYQSHAIKFGALTGSYFNADQPGTGKTLETLGSLVEKNIRGMVLVLAPKKALEATWRNQIRQWMAPDFNINILVANSDEGRLEERNELISQAFNADLANQFTFVIVNPEAARIVLACPKKFCTGNKHDCPYTEEHTKTPVMPALFAQPWDAIVLDESHKYMVKANWRSASASQVGYGIQKLPLKPDGIKIGLSGTPFKGKPRRFWPVLHWLNANKYTGEWRWSERYFESVKDHFAHSGKKITDTMKEEMREEFYGELSRIMIRRTKKELRELNPAWAPPDKQYVSVVLKPDPKQKKAYEQMATAATAHLDSGTLMATGVLAEMTRLKQLAGAYGRVAADGSFASALPSCKWEWIRDEFLTERGIMDGDHDNPIKVVIASQFVQILEMYAAELEKKSIPHFIISGKNSIVGAYKPKNEYHKRVSRSVSQIQEQWQRPWEPGDPRVLLLSTTAGGVSLTLDAADDLVLNDQTWSPDEQEQVEDRIHRTGRTDHQVTVYELVTAGTIEETIAINNYGRDVDQKEILDGRRGVEFAKNLIGEVKK